METKEGGNSRNPARFGDDSTVKGEWLRTVHAADVHLEMRLAAPEGAKRAFGRAGAAVMLQQRFIALDK